jgi:hypothetical protein
MAIDNAAGELRGCKPKAHRPAGERFCPAAPRRPGRDGREYSAIRRGSLDGLQGNSVFWSGVGASGSTDERLSRSARGPADHLQDGAEAVLQVLKWRLRDGQSCDGYS